MKQTLLSALTVGAVAYAVMTTVVYAQQVPLPTTAAQVPGPAPGTAMIKPYVQAVERTAYVWGWPLVNAANRAVAFRRHQLQGCWVVRFPWRTTDLRC